MSQRHSVCRQGLSQQQHAVGPPLSQVSGSLLQLTEVSDNVCACLLSSLDCVFTELSSFLGGVPPRGPTFSVADLLCCINTLNMSLLYSVFDMHSLCYAAFLDQLLHFHVLLVIVRCSEQRTK